MNVALWRGHIPLMLLVVLLMLSVACRREVAPPPPLRIVHGLWAGYYALDVASETTDSTRALGTGADAMRLATITIHTSPSDLYADFAGGSFDAVAGSLPDLLRLQQSVRDLKIVVCTDESNGADALIAAAPFPSIGALRGKRIAIAPGTFVEVLLAQALEREGLHMQDVEIITTTASHAVHLLQSDSVEAIVTWSPPLDAVRQPPYHILYSSSQTPGLILQCLAVRKHILETRANTVRQLVSRLLALSTTYADSADALRPLAARAQGRPVSALPPAIGMRWLTPQENRQLLRAGGDGTLKQSAEPHIRYLTEIGGLRSRPDFRVLMTSDFLPP